MDVLSDDRELDTRKMSMPELQALSRFIGRWGHRLGSGRWAVVMSREIDFGNARQWAAFTENEAPPTIQVFRDMAKAEAWIQEGRA